MKNLNEKIIELLNKEDITEIGFVKLEYFKELEQILIKQDKLGYKTEFQKGNIDEKVFKNQNKYKSAIVVLLPYQKNDLCIEKNKIYVSSSSWGVDYHIVLKSKLKTVVEFLETKNYISCVSVDNSIYDEKYLAYKAGLGFYGINNLLINDKYGSYFFVGLILTDAEFKYNKELTKTCLKCMKCVKACPGQAINENGILDGKKCVSYITQKKELTVDEKSKINQCVYGCDICSIVCPHNKNIEKNNNFLLDENVIIDLNKFKSMSNKEFKRKYGEYAFSWRGKKVFERNINIYKEKLEKK